MELLVLFHTIPESQLRFRPPARGIGFSFLACCTWRSNGILIGQKPPENQSLNPIECIDQ